MPNTSETREVNVGLRMHKDGTHPKAPSGLNHNFQCCAKRHFPLFWPSFHLTYLFTLLISAPISWALSLASPPESKVLRCPVFLPSYLPNVFEVTYACRPR